MIKDFENKKIEKNKILLHSLSCILGWGWGWSGGRGERGGMCAGWNQSTNYKCCSEYEFTGEESEEIGPDSDSVTD